MATVNERIETMESTLSDMNDAIARLSKRQEEIDGNIRDEAAHDEIATLQANLRELTDTMQRDFITKENAAQMVAGGSVDGDAPISEIPYMTPTPEYPGGLWPAILETHHGDDVRSYNKSVKSLPDD